MARNLTELFIETTLERLDQLDERLKTIEKRIFDDLIDKQIIEMSTPPKG